MSNSESSAQSRSAAYALSALLIGAWLAYGVWFGGRSLHHLEHSDTLGLLYLAERMEWTRPATWFSGFYGPAAIALFKAQGGTAAAATTLYWSSFVAATVAMLSAAGYAGRLLRSPWAVPLTLVAASAPSAWQVWSTTACVDTYAAAALALALAASPREPAPRRSWLLAAAFVALAGSLRVHTLGFGVPWLFLASLPRGSENGLRASSPASSDNDLRASSPASSDNGLRASSSASSDGSDHGLRAFLNGLRASAPIAVGAVVAGLLPSMLASASSGHGVYRSFQSFNVYKLVHGVDWRTVGEESVPASLMGVIVDAPGAAISAYASAVFGNAWVLGFCAVALGVIAVRSVRERAGRAGFEHIALAISLALYVLAASVGDSPRTLVPVSPLAAVLLVSTLGLVVRSVRREIGRIALVGATAALCLVVAGIHLTEHRGEAERRAAVHDTLIQVESLLVGELGVTDAREVFADAHDVFLPSTAPRLPNRPGGWARIDDVDFDVAYPSLCVTDLACFAESAREAGIRAVVLSSNLGPSTPGLQHARSLRSAEQGFVPIGMVGDLLIGAIPGARRRNPELSSRPSGVSELPSGMASSQPSGMASSWPSGVGEAIRE